MDDVVDKSHDSPPIGVDIPVIRRKGLNRSIEHLSSNNPKISGPASYHATSREIVLRLTLNLKAMKMEGPLWKSTEYRLNDYLGRRTDVTLPRFASGKHLATTALNRCSLPLRPSPERVGNQFDPIPQRPPCPTSGGI